MSPVTHATIGWLIAQPLPNRRDRVIVTLAGVIPDLDGVTILAGADSFERWHHSFGHNIFAAILVMGICALCSKKHLLTALLSFLAFHAHLLCDLFGSSGWPIYYFWPISEKFFEFAPPFQWELSSWQNFLITLLSFIAIGVQGVRQGRTIFEVLSLKIDGILVHMLQRLFAKEK